MELELIDIVNGISSLAFLIISLILGFKIISKYFKFKRKEFILVGIAGILLSELFWPITISFLLVLVIDENLSPELLLFIGIFLLPFTVLIWLKIFTNFSHKERQNLLLIIFVIEGILFEILFIYFLFTDLSIIGFRQGSMDIRYGLFISIYLFFLLIIVIVVGTIFSLESLKSDNPHTRIRGKFFILAYYSFFIAGIFEILRDSSMLLLIISRVLLILSGMEFYVGFMFPNWIKKLYFREK